MTLLVFCEITSFITLVFNPLHELYLVIAPLALLQSRKSVTRFCCYAAVVNLVAPAVVTREKAMPGALVSRPLSSAAVAASPDVGAPGPTQMKRRKQLAVRWYCVCCEKCSEHDQDVVTLLCLQCGVSMVCSKRQKSNTVQLHRVSATAPTPPPIELAAAAGVLRAEKRPDAAHAKMPAAAVGDSRNDCVCIVLQGTLSLARVRLSVSR